MNRLGIVHKADRSTTGEAVGVSLLDYSLLTGFEAPPTAEELAEFADLQARFAQTFGTIFDDPHAPRTVLIVPSLSVDQQVMAKITGAHHYEERMLCLLLLLRMPRTQVIYVTSTPISGTIIDYYLHLLPGVPGVHSRRRLTLVSCDDDSPRAQTRKILERPHVIAQIAKAIPDLASAHMTCFTVSELERKLALVLGLPIYGCDPSLRHWGEDIAGEDDVALALAELKGATPELRKAVVKLNEGFSGEGYAVFDFRDAPTNALLPWVRTHLPELAFEALSMQ